MYSGLNKRLNEVNVSASLSAYLLKDLQPGTAYELSILAENEVIIFGIFKDNFFLIFDYNLTIIGW